MNLIKAVHIRTERGRPQQILPLITNGYEPTERKVTVICGRNRSGKSHLLEQLDVSINEHNYRLKNNKPVNGTTPLSRNICCALTHPDRPATGVFYFRDPDFMISQATVIRYSRDFRLYPRPEKNISLAMLRLLRSHFQSHANRFDPGRWDNEPAYRTEQMKQYGKDDRIFRLFGESDCLRQFEDLTSAKLYFRFLKKAEGHEQAELVLRYSPRHHYPYCSWSHGQRVLFCFLCVIEYFEIEVLLLDELETHLHPQFMTFLFERIKAKIPQTIAATHHPHLIFSKLVDSIWYLEVAPDDYNAPENEVFAGSPSSRNTPLATTLVSASTRHGETSYQL